MVAWHRPLIIGYVDWNEIMLCCATHKQDTEENSLLLDSTICVGQQQIYKQGLQDYFYAT